jgi:predicted metal-dependent enzyme (double-stranded beta helix superfamily)
MNYNIMMECPTCQSQLHSNMNNALVGKNKRNASIFVYFQICPECDEPIIGIKEAARGEVYMNPNNIEGLVLWRKEHRR